MQFSKVIGNIDPDLVSKAEQKLTQVFADFCQPYSSGQGTGIGGDPFIYAMLYPIQHICTINLPTAATDGKLYYWNPKFVLKKSFIGLRFIAYHEAGHAIYMHPARRSTRIPKLWNIAVDYIVNGMVMDDLKARKRNAAKDFETHLGKYMTLEKYATFLKDPFKDGQTFEPSHIKNQIQPDLERELTQEELDNLEKEEKREKFFFADDDLKEEFQSPENIYDYLYSLLPKCPKCGKVGMYKKPKPKDDKDKKDQAGDKPEDKKDEKSSKDKKNKSKDKQKSKEPCPQHGDKQESKDKSDQDGDKGDQNDQGDKDQGDKDQGDQPSDNHEHGGDKPCTCPHDHGKGQGEGQGDGDGQSTDGCDQEGGCDSCGGDDMFDIFDAGGTLDDHMDTSEDQEKLAKRVAEAIDLAKRMAGRIPAGIEAELGKLVEPKMRWQDIIRIKKSKARAGHRKSDYTRFRTKPMFAGVLLPKKIDRTIRFGCLMDTSGSMSEEDILFGISQLKSLDERTEGVIVPADSVIYWDDATYIRKMSEQELVKTKIVGRGGTMFGEFTSDYKKKIGECDFLIFITDGYLIDSDVASMKDPGIDVVWILTANSSFKPPFGKAFMLRD